MSNSNQNLKPFLIFPENSASIISDILKRYNLKEPNEALLEKWKSGKKSLGAILADLVIKTLTTNLSLPELADLIQKELNISARKSQKIIEDLNKEIITPAIQISEKTLPKKESLSEKKPKEILEPLKPKTKDFYREQIK